MTEKLGKILFEMYLEFSVWTRFHLKFMAYTAAHQQGATFWFHGWEAGWQSGAVVRSSPGSTPGPPWGLSVWSPTFQKTRMHLGTG